MEEPPKHPAVAALFAELLTATKLNAAGLAKKLGITPQAISNYIVGRNEPGRKIIAAIIKAFPAINAVWLATGEGQPFPNGVHGEKRNTPPTDSTPSVKTEPDTAPAATVPSLHTVERKHIAPMAILPDMEGMSAEEQIQTLTVRLTLAEDELAAIRNAERHKEAVQLVRSAGGRSFNDASADAADTTDTPPVMVAETNREYVERAAEAERNRIGFVFGQGR